MNDVASSGADIQKSMLEATFDALGLAVLVCDENDEIVFASRPILQLYAIAREFIAPGTRLRDFLGAVYDTGLRGQTSPEKSRRRVNRDDWIAERISYHWRERHETVERIGQQRWAAVRMRRLSNGLGVVSFTDISEQKKREEQLQLDMERIGVTETILDQMPNPVFVKDRGLTYIGVNRAFCAIHGVAPESILGRSVWDLVDPELAEKFERSDRHVLETGEPFTLAEQLVRSDGEDLWVLTRKFRVGEAGKYLLVTCMDDVNALITGTEFRANEPLRIKDYDLFEPGQNCYDPFRSIDIQHIKEAVSIIEPASSMTKRALVLAQTDGMEEWLVPQLGRWGFDACAVRDRKELSAFAEAAASCNLSIDILLVDAESSDIRAVLSAWNTSPFLIVGRDRKIADLHADIEALVEYARAPKSDSAEPATDWDMIVPDEPIDILQPPEVEVVVAEDNEINQFVFAQILEGLGISYRLAVNGEEAVRLWHEHRPSLVLMDLSMPVMNGFDAAIAIRAAEAGSLHRTPIVAVTTPALDIDIDRSRAAGMDDYITKPISPDMIEAVYRKFVGIREERLAG